MERKKAYYWCTCLQMITPIKVRRLIEKAGGPSDVFGQSDEACSNGIYCKGAKNLS